MYYGALKLTDFADGPGCRVALYVSGCQLALEGHPCKGCHNAMAWNKEFGKPFTEQTKKEIFDAMDKKYISGFSLLGGEPFSSFNIEECTALVKEIKERFPEKDIWAWSGYIYEDLLKKYPEIFKYLDYLVDGPYDESLSDPNLEFRGSSNQRIIRLS